MIEPTSRSPTPTAPAPPDTARGSLLLRLPLAVLCFFAGSSCLAFIIGTAVFCAELGIDLSYFLAEAERLIALAVFLTGLGIGSVLFFDAAWSFYRGRWERASIGSILALSSIGAIVGCIMSR
jgi:hypothetical protein